MEHHAVNHKGLVSGKFMPLHEGHLQLIRTAASKTDELTVIISSSSADPIPGARRYAWLKEIFPRLRVLHLPGVQYPHAEDQQFSMETWAKTIQQNMPDGVDVLYSTNPADSKLAQQLGARFSLLERDENTAMISSASILLQPFEHWQYLPPAVRSSFVKRFVLTGPESVGKTVLAEKLAAHFNTVWVEEYGREYCEKFGNDLTPLDFAHIAGGQILLEDEAARKAHQLLICDTDLVVTQIWGEIFLGSCPPWIIEMNHRRHYDGFLLLAPDIDWVNDGIRVYGSQREKHFLRLLDELASRNLPYILISGNYQERFEQAVRAIEGWMEAKRTDG